VAASMMSSLCEQPLHDVEVATSMAAPAARGASEVSSGAKANTDEGLDSDKTRGTATAGPNALTGAVGGQSAAHADVDSQAPHAGGCTVLLSWSVQDKRNHTHPASDVEAAPLTTQSVQRCAPPETDTQSMLTAVPDQLNMPGPPQAAPRSEAGSDAPSLSASRQADVQQPVPAPPQTAPSAGGGAAAVLPPLPRLPAVTTASLPPLAEVLAPVALPAASFLIGAGSPWSPCDLADCKQLHADGALRLTKQEHCLTGKLSRDADRGRPPLIASVPAMRTLASALQPKPVEPRASSFVPSDCLGPKPQLIISELLRALPIEFGGCGPNFL